MADRVPPNPEASDEPQVLADLREARRTLAECGWATFRYRDDNGCVCAEGAINIAITGNPRAGGGPRQRACRQALMRVVGPVSNIAYWNDRQDSDVPVFAAFDQAIKFFTEASRDR